MQKRKPTSTSSSSSSPPPAADSPTKPAASPSTASSASEDREDDVNHEPIRVGKFTSAVVLDMGRGRHRDRDKLVRRSLLDLEGVTLETRSDLWGWYNLAIITTFFYAVVTIVQNVGRHGVPLTTGLFFSALHDLPLLVTADICMCLASLLTFPLQKVITSGLVSRKLGIILQHTLQTSLFVISISFIWARDFPWLQSASFLMHTMVMFMKMHSYLSINRQLSDELKKNKVLKKTGPPRELREDEVWEEVVYPDNITIKRFLEFWFYPVLVYQPNVLRTKYIRPQYVAEKGAGFVGLLTMMYMTVEHYVLPVLQEAPTKGLLQTLTGLLVPMLVSEILLFFLVFELLCNFMAEILRLAPRHFYSDWWNSTSFDEFARKWNRPVHEWLSRHIYVESMTAFSLTKKQALLLTFFFSSVMHELIMIASAKKLRFYFFGLQIMQLPLIYLGHLPMFRTRPRWGNVWFWFALCVGTPILTIAYTQPI